MLMVLEKSNCDKFNEFKEWHPANIPKVLLTFKVLNFDKSKFLRFEHE